MAGSARLADNQFWLKNNRLDRGSRFFDSLKQELCCGLAQLSRRGIHGRQARKTLRRIRDVVKSDYPEVLACVQARMLNGFDNPESHHIVKTERGRWAILHLQKFLHAVMTPAAVWSRRNNQ